MSTDDLDLMQLASAGDLIATVDAVEYRAVHMVLAWPAGGLPALYCAYADWPQTLPARLAAKEQELSDLAAGLDRYAAEATAQAQRAEAAERRAQELERRLAALETTLQREQATTVTHAGLNGGADKRIVCGHCGKRIWPDLFDKHMLEKHPSAPTAPIQRVDDQGWHCAVRGCDGAHTRSLLEPDFCTHHAKPHVNGLEVAHDG